MSNKTILIIDDEIEICNTLKEIFEEEGYNAITASNSKEAFQLFTEEISVVLLDIKLGSDNGLDILKTFTKKYSYIPIIMITGHGTVALASQAFKLGAHEFIEKPLRLLHVKTCVRNAVESASLKQKLVEQKRELLPKPIFISKIMVDLFDQTKLLAAISESVVILGPSGSGKELIAQSLHYDGIRKDEPFVATNAASLPVTLAEDELFGHEKGAFTGATTRRIGKLELAKNGTIFLDEIADLDIQIQAKLLRVLECGEFTRLGGNETVKVNARVISATHRDIEKLIEAGEFRHDLWYRLCAFMLKVPPLKDRVEDIPLLANQFLKQICLDNDTDKELSNDAIIFLKNRDYSGNIRELKHIITRAVVFSKDKIITEALIKQVANPNQTVLASNNNTFSNLNFKEARKKFEIDYFSAALKDNNNNITKAAISTGMAQSNLSRKLKELNLR